MSLGEDIQNDVPIIGTSTDVGYVSQFLGLRFQPGSEWTFMTDEQIRQNNETAMGMMGGDYAEAIKNAATFTDMMAAHSNGTDTVNVTFEKRNGLNAILTVSQYAEASNNLKSALESMGMHNVTVAIGSTTFAEEQTTCLDVTAQYNGYQVYEKMAILLKDSYMVCIVACTWNTDYCQDVLNLFRPLSEEPVIPDDPEPPVTDPKDQLAGSTGSGYYVSEFLNLQCCPPYGWLFYTDEEIRQNNEAAMEMLGDNYTEALKNAVFFTDMMMVHTNGTDTANITFEKLTGANAELTESEYANLSKPAIKNALKNIGVSNIKITAGTSTFLGKECVTLYISGKSYGYTLYEQAVVFKHDEYMITVTSCSWNNNICQEILNFFQPLQ